MKTYVHILGIFILSLMKVACNSGSNSSDSQDKPKAGGLQVEGLIARKYNKPLDL